ncbi:MAG: hypothetical protein ACE5FA_10285 [Dehalococcoidia bacterium]
MLSTLSPIPILAPLFTALIAVPPPLPTDLPDELSAVSRTWLRQNWQEQHETGAYLIAAYDLGEEIRPAFWHDFYTLLADLYAYEKTFFEENMRLTPDEILKRYQAYPNEMPMSDEKLLAMVESLLGPADYSLPRQNYFELKERRSLRTWVVQDQTILTKNLRRWFRSARLSHVAHRTEAGRPMPYWVYINRRNQAIREETKSLATQRENRLAARRRSSRIPGGAVFQRLRTGIKPPLEPEDSIARPTVAPATAPIRIEPGIDATRHAWRSVVEAAITRGRTDREQAERLFDEIWSRVVAMRSTRSVEYKAMEGISDKNTCTIRLAELDRPLAGLFAELKCRLAK